MALLDFPASPAPNQVYTLNGRSWIWNGTSWKSYNLISGGGAGTVNVGNIYEIPYYPSTSATISGSSYFLNVGTGLTVLYTAPTISKGSGALVIHGGIGISGGASIGQTLFFYNNTNSNYVAFKAGASTANTTYILPTSTPATGTSVLQSDSSGVLSWVSQASGSLTGTGTSAYVPLWTSAGTALTNSIISQSSTTIDIAGHLKARTKSFLIPHPLNPEKLLLEHGSLEGPEHGVYVRGTASGMDEATVYLPDYWDKLVEGKYTILLTSRVPYTLYIKKQDYKSFTIKRSKGFLASKKRIEFDYFVVAERSDIKIQIIQPRY